MKSTIIALLFAGAAAQAHIAPGVHQGVNAQGKPCSMTVGRTSFENNLQHPLNERIEISIDGVAFLVRHPATINSAQGAVGFNHDLFQGLVATTDGAKAVEIEMVHEAGAEGPKAFVMMTDSWRSRQRASYRCQSLRHAGSFGFRR